MTKKTSTRLFDEVLNTVTPADAIKALTFDRKTHQYKFSTAGNIKLGKILSWSTLLGDYVYKKLTGVLKNIKGTCGNCDACKKDCYVRASYRFPGVIHSQAVNTYGLREELDKVEQNLAAQLKRSKIDIVRINQSGELENEEQFAMWCRLAMAYPSKKFYIYTKMYGIVTKALLAGNVPSNFVVNYSVWHDVGVKEYQKVSHLENAKAFVYDDGEVMIKPDTYCMAYQNGKLDHNVSCEKCGKCYNKRAVNVAQKVIGCHAH